MDSQSEPLVPNAYDAIRIKKTDKGTVVTYPLRMKLHVKDLRKMVILVVGTSLLLLVSPFFLGEMTFSRGGRASFGMLLLVALVGGLFLMAILNSTQIVRFFIGKAKFTVEDGWLIFQHLPQSDSKEGGRVKLADIERVVVAEAYADKDEGFRYQLVAYPPKGKGTPTVLIDRVDPDAGRALCTVLHEHLSVPVGS